MQLQAVALSLGCGAAGDDAGMPGKVVTTDVTTSQSDIVVQDWKDETAAINALYRNCCPKCKNSGSRKGDNFSGGSLEEVDVDEDWRPSLTLDNFAFFRHVVGQDEVLVALDDVDKVSTMYNLVT